MDWLIVILIDRSMQLMNLFFHSSHSFFLSFFFLHHRSQNEKLTRTGQGRANHFLGRVDRLLWKP